MTKSQTLEAIISMTGLNKKDVSAVLDALAAVGFEAAKVDGEFVVPHFGKLVKVDRKARIGRNPATGQTINIPAKTVLKFRIAKAVKDAVL